MSSLGHHANDCSNAPGGDTDGASNSTAPTELTNDEGSLAPAAHEPSAPQCVSSAAMTPAQESCESPPMMTARLALGTSALSSRRRSAAYLPVVKVQFNRYRPGRQSPRRSTGTALPPSPKDSRLVARCRSSRSTPPAPRANFVPRRGGARPLNASAAFSTLGSSCPHRRSLRDDRRHPRRRAACHLVREPRELGGTRHLPFLAPVRVQARLHVADSTPSATRPRRGRFRVGRGDFRCEVRPDVAAGVGVRVRARREPRLERGTTTSPKCTVRL